MIPKCLAIIALVLLLCACDQESFFFHPQKLPSDYRFSFKDPYKEYYVQVDSKTRLNGLLFRSNPSKGLIFYLHGNAGTLELWGEIARLYLRYKYDVFILDYRGFGKSEGAISSESQIYSDVQKVYDVMKKEYDEKRIVILGYSIGTGPAAHLAATNQPRMLVLLAPYYSSVDLIKHYTWAIPPFAITYKFKTNQFIPRVSAPIVIFHGDQDEIIPYDASVRLSRLLKRSDMFITLKGQRHGGVDYNETYRMYMDKLLR